MKRIKGGDEGLRNASNLAGNIIEQAAKMNNPVTKIEGA